MDQNKVSIIMSVYNEPKEVLNKSIESILNQTYRNFEFIIILDKPSNYDAIEIINYYSSRDQRIIFIKNDKNMGLARSLNNGLKIATGNFIARMDADDISDLSRIEYQINYLNYNKNIDFTSTLVKYIDESDNELEDKNIFIYTNTQKVNSIMINKDIMCHPTWMFRRKVLDGVKEYRIFPCSEDYDFILRVIEYGYKVSIINKKLLKYRIRNSGITKSNDLLMIKYSLYIQYLSKQRKVKKSDNIDYRYINSLKENSNEMILLEKARNIFKLGLINLKNKRYLIGIAKIIKSCFVSRDQWMCIKNSLLWRINVGRLN